MLLGQSYRTPHGAMINEYGAMGGMMLTGKTEELGENPVPVQLCPPQIPEVLTWARTQASVMRGQRLTA
jgi:hypothetical protein